MANAKNLVECKDKVEKILKRSKSTRSSDKLLYVAYLEAFCGLNKTIGSENVLKLIDLMSKDSTPSMDTISRIRRRLNEKGLYIPENNTRKTQEILTREAIRDL